MLKRLRHEPPCKNSFFVFRENRNHGVYFYTDIQLLQTGVFFYSVRFVNVNENLSQVLTNI